MSLTLSIAGAGRSHSYLSQGPDLEILVQVGVIVLDNYINTLLKFEQQTANDRGGQTFPKSSVLMRVEPLKVFETACSVILH